MSTDPNSRNSEFNIIDRFFRRERIHPSIILGIGDDCALVAPESNQTLAITTDTLVEGIHFVANTDPKSLGHKSLAVNLSDLAAMGAIPRWATLALTLPSVNEAWLAEFSKGFFDLADRYSVELIGGDTTRGPLTITTQAIGTVSPGKAMLRSGASAGDFVYVTGLLGDAGLGLKVLNGEFDCFAPEQVDRLLYPEPRIAAGHRLAGFASGCIDVSDGLTADLGHILESSGLGATLFWDKLPFSPAVQRYITTTGDWQMPLTAGDDYELCFTVSPGQIELLNDNSTRLACAINRIGVIEENTGLRVLKDSRRIDFLPKGFVHFTGG